MSIHTWEKEFLIECHIKKWIGLKYINLHKHEVKVHHGTMYGMMRVRNAYKPQHKRIFTNFTGLQLFERHYHDTATFNAYNQWKQTGDCSIMLRVIKSKLTLLEHFYFWRMSL